MKNNFKEANGCSQTLSNIQQHVCIYRKKKKKDTFETVFKQLNNLNNLFKEFKQKAEL